MAYYSVEIVEQMVDDWGDLVSEVALLDYIKGEFATTSAFVLDGPVRVSAANQVFITTKSFAHLLAKGNLIDGKTISAWSTNGSDIVVQFEAQT